MTFYPTGSSAWVETEAGQVASAVVDVLNDGTIELPSMAERNYMPAVELKTALDTSVLVAATNRTLIPETRGGSKVHVPGTIPSSQHQKRFVLIEIGVSKKFGEYSDIETADPVLLLCEQIANLFASIKLEVSSTLHAYPVVEKEIESVEHFPLYDPKLWRENMQITGVVKINYRLVDVS